MKIATNVREYNISLHQRWPMLLPTRLQVHGSRYLKKKKKQALISQHNQQSMAIETINKRTKNDHREGKTN